MKTLDELLREPIRGRRVFVRADLNVPLRGGVIRDDSRIRASIPTLEKLAAAGARVIVASHLGRPKGHVVPEQSLEPVAHRLRQLLESPVSFVSECVGERVQAAVQSLRAGEILVLENLRFHAGEEENDRAFAAALAEHCDVYVFDAFGTAHRAHASTVGMPEFCDDCVVGDLVLRETSRLERLLDPPRPFVCLLGGAKVSSKAKLLEALILRADVIALGGAMPYPFLDWTGHCVGRSPVEREVRETVEYALAAAERMDCEFMLPTDHYVVTELDSGEKPRREKEIPVEALGVDIGPATADRYVSAIESAGSVFWNGPMGIFEMPGCATGTERIAHAVACCEGYTVVGGAETVAALREFGVEAGPDHVSSGGGAALEFVAGSELPALVALTRVGSK